MACISRLLGIVDNSGQLVISSTYSVAIWVLSRLLFIIVCAFFKSAGLLLSLIAFASSLVKVGFQSIPSKSFNNALLNNKSASSLFFTTACHAFCSLFSNICLLIYHLSHLAWFSLSFNVLNLSCLASCKNNGWCSVSSRVLFNPCIFLSHSPLSANFSVLTSSLIAFR